MDKELFTSFEGRINRQNWWVGLLVLAIAEWIAIIILSMVFGVSMMGSMQPADPSGMPHMSAGTGVLIGIVGLIFLWPGLAVYTKRWHDRNKSGWWTLIGLIPIIGGLWLLIELGFLRGTDGPNRFGPNPLGR